MKNIVLVFLVIFNILQCASQVINDSGNHGLMLVTTKKNKNLAKVEGSPYLDEDFLEGTVIVKGKQPLKVFVRYNVLQEELEIKTDKTGVETYSLPKNETTTYYFNSDTWVYNHLKYNGREITGFFNELFKGATLRLLEKPIASISEPVKAKTGYEKDKPAQIIIEHEYYLINNNNEVEKIPISHRKIKKMFDSQKARDYLNKNKIRSEEDLIKFISFLDK